MRKMLFDQYSEPKATLMRQQMQKDFGQLVDAYPTDGVPGGQILEWIDQVATHIAAAFRVSKDDLFVELTDYMDATIWADNVGGINNPLPGQPRNRFADNREETRTTEWVQ